MNNKTVLAVILVAMSHSPMAQTNEAGKRHYVNRFYQAFFGPLENCKAVEPSIANAIKAKTDSIRAKYPDPIRLAAESPHYPAAKENFQPMVKSLGPKQLNEWCSESIAMMAHLFESESSRALMEDMKSVLSK